MKKFLSIVLVLALLVSFAPSFEHTEAKAAGGNLISYVPEQHPRLLVHSFDEQKAKIAENPLAASWYHELKKEVDALLEQPTHAYDVDKLQIVADGGGQRRIIDSPTVLGKFFGLAFVTMIEDDNRYLDRLWAEVEVAANLPCWNEAHWLETAELLQSFAIAYDWCYDKWSDEQLDVMHEAMVKMGLEHAFREYEDNPRYYEWHWGFEGDEVGTNWTCVCNTGVIMGCIALADVESSIADELLNMAIKSIKSGANEFIPDGSYREGAMYWKYAITNLILGAACLESGLDAFDGFDHLPELEEPFSYDIVNYEGVGIAGDFATYLNGPWGAFNCGDGVVDKKTSTALMYMGKRLNRPDYVKNHIDIVASNPTTIDEYVQTIIWYDPEMDLNVGNVPLDKDFAMGVSTMRNSWATGDDTVFVATKAGGVYPHGHVDVGTFCLEALGERWVTMRGAGNYDWPGYGDGVTYYVRRPEGQNTLIINPDDTRGQNMEEFMTELYDSKSGKDEAYVIYDLTNAYSDYAESVYRGIKLFDNRGRVLVQDEIVFSEPENTVWWFAHTGAEMSISESGKEVILSQNGEKMFARILSPANAEFRIQEAAPLPDSPNPAIQPGTYGSKLAILLEEMEDSTTIAVEFTPLADGMAPPSEENSHPVTALKDWCVDEEDKRLEVVADGVVAMLQDSSLAYAKSEKKQIDPENADIKPVLQNDRTMVPLRFIAENIGGEISWNDETREVAVSYNHQQIVTKIGESTITVDGEQKPLDSPSFIQGGRTYVPLRAISEAMGKFVYDENGLVIISDTELPFEDYPDHLEELRALLKYNVIVNGESFFSFNPAKSDYRIFAGDENSVSVDVAGEADIGAQSGETVYVTIAGTDYSFEFVPDEFEITEPYLTSIAVSCVEADEFVPESGDEATHIPVKSVVTSGDDGNVGSNMVDSYIETRWSAQGEQYAQFDLGEEYDVSYMYASFFAGATRCEIFDILTSVDGENWTTVYSGQADGTTTEMQPFELEPSSARYIKYQAHGNSKSTWNSVTEIRFYETVEDAEADAEDWDELLEPSGIQYFAGEAYHCAIEGYMSDGEVININPSDAIWYASDDNIAYVDESGTVEFFNSGTVAIVATYNTGKYYRVNKITLTAQ
ncbi:MAG: hypothetical protein E7395_04575 [Ruminococcaceae bacterium]|nr:hypothetical protein [Oscillospiraceae bacterium]